MKRIILIRHGSKKIDTNVKDRDLPLSYEGRDETRLLGNMLARLNLKPEVYLTSEYKHANEMGEILSTQLDNKSPGHVVNLAALTPLSPTETLEEIVEEANEKEIDLSKLEVVALIGHEPRLSQLLARLTSKRTRPFQRAEAACLIADSLPNFELGKGIVDVRIPVADYQEDQLRPKIRSKMTVSTFLAGFTFSALFWLLKEVQTNFSQWQMVSVICLTAALALFIASVYMYDRMGMPEGFWVYGDRPKSLKTWGKKFGEDRRLHGPLYAHMVWTWRYVFTPGVVVGFGGFTAILLATKIIAVINGGLAVIIGVFIYYIITRPKLGTD